MFGARLYDAIGGAYPAARRTDPRIAAQVWDALGDARTVLNVGAGTGSYEPPDRDVTAVEPSAVMEGSHLAEVNSGRFFKRDNTLTVALVNIDKLDAVGQFRRARLASASFAVRCWADQLAHSDNARRQSNLQAIRHVSLQYETSVDARSCAWLV